MSIRAMLSVSRLLIVLSAAVFLVSPSIGGTELKLEPVSVKKGSLAVVVDPRVELLSIVQYLSSYHTDFPGLVTRYQFPYRTDVDDWFSRSKDHPVLAMFGRMSAKGFSFDAPPHVILYLNPDLSLDPVIFENAKGDVQRAGGKEQMTAFAAALRSFAVESGFPEFYAKHASFYKQIAEQTMKTVGDIDNVGQLERYYGEERNSYSVVITSLLGGGSFGPQIERQKGVKDIFDIMGPTDVRGGIPVFGTTDGFSYLQRHEFSHSFVNPLTDKYWDLADKYSDLLPPMKQKMQAQAYDKWWTVLNESIIRAVTTRLAYLMEGPEAGDRELNYNTSRGFVFTDALAGKLKEYEQSRDKYPTLDSYYPELLTALDAFSTDSIRDVFAKDPLVLNQQFDHGKYVVYEIPGGDGKDDAINYARQMRDRFHPTWEIMDASNLDEPVLKDRLRDGFILYTTIGSSLFTAVTRPLGIKIENGIFEWQGVKAPVAELRVILVGKNPYGDGYCSVYAGGTNRLVVDINSVFHGPCSYHIFKGRELLKEGNYDGKFAGTDPEKKP